MAQIKSFTSSCVYLPINDIDTDQIIPARYLKTIDKAGLGSNLFSDWRYLPDGSTNMEFVLNQKASHGAKVLFAGRNFGCGSSREHAPWALTGYGFQAVIAPSFGDIFRNNALKNGLLPIQLDHKAYEKLSEMLAEIPNSQITIDLETQTVTLPDGQKAFFSIDAFSKTCLLKGTDDLGYLLSFKDRISEFERQP
jgi:3-isopropylmalate/(R)-2-methylmalate dehydratase small subunit